METPNEVKKMVKDKYAEIAKAAKGSGCCGPVDCCGSTNESNIIDYSVFQDDYTGEKGYNPDADLGLGCGIPTQYAQIKEGDTVIDLGSGAGNDVFVARSIVGNSGKVIGLDMTEEMIQKAEKNNSKLGYDNVEFKFGDIEEMPVESNIADVIISNCVLNLVPNKQKAFSEIYRVLKPGAHFCISDIVIEGELPEGLKKSAEMYAGCVSGALQKDEYLKIIKQNGFKNVEIKKTKVIELPESLLSEFINDEEIIHFKNSKTGIFSITVVGYK